jgi:RNA polymerase sigma factor (sigma-70 family)
MPLVDADAFGPELLRVDVEDRTQSELFSRLLVAYTPAFRRLVAAHAVAIADREDLVQDIAIALWRALPRFRGECSERTFVFRVAHNRAIAFLARRRPRINELDEGSEAPDPRPSQEVEMVRKQQALQLLQAVRRLPIAYREIVTLSLEGLDYREIAQVAGISETNVGARLTRARQMLRKELKGEHDHKR